MTTTASGSFTEVSIVAKSGDPIDVAKAILAHKFRTPGGMPSLIIYGGDWFQYRDGLWSVQDRARVKGDMYLSLPQVWTEKKDKETNKTVRSRVRSSKLLLDSMMLAVENLCTVWDEISIPRWLKGGEGWNNEFSLTFEDVVVDAKASAERGQIVSTPRTDLWFEASVIPCKWDPKAISPTLERCLEEWSEGEANWKTTWLRGMAYTVMAHRSARLFLNYGVPRSGKGITEEIRKMLLGKDLYLGLQMSSLSKNFGLHGIASARTIVIPEVSELDKRGSEQASAIIKAVLGKDAFDIDRKYLDPVKNVVSKAAIVMLGNQIPNLANSGGSISSKIVPLNFDKTFLGKENWDLVGALRAELPGIANMVVRAAMELIGEKDNTKKFPLTAGSKVAMEKFLALNSPADGFLEWGYVPSPKGLVSTDVVYSDYVRFCESLPMKDLGRVSFYRWLEAQNSWGVFKTRNTKTGYQVFKGLKRKDRLGFDKAGTEVEVGTQAELEEQGVELEVE